MYTEHSPRLNPFAVLHALRFYYTNRTSAASPCTTRSRVPRAYALYLYTRTHRVILLIIIIYYAYCVETERVTISHAFMIILQCHVLATG